MKYDSVRDNIKNGDLLAFSGDTIFSRAIQSFTKSVISHVGLAVWIRSRLCVIEAVEKAGTRLYPVSRYVHSKTNLEWWDLVADTYNVNREDTVDFAVENLGLKYSRWQVIEDFILMRMKKRKTFYCSLYVLESLRAGGYLGEGFDDPNPSPGEVTRLPCFHRQGYLEP